MAKVIIDGKTGTVISEDLGLPSENRSAKYAQILAERDSRLKILREDMEELEDARAIGADPDDTKILAHRQTRHDLRQKAKTVKSQIDDLGNDSRAILNFNVKAAFDA